MGRFRFASFPAGIIGGIIFWNGGSSAPAPLIDGLSLFVCVVESPIQALAAEAAGQPGVLARFAHQELPRARRGSIFVGAGDSYAAALAGFSASGGRCMALDPYVLASAPEIADGADVYIVSVSGRTSSNALVAKRVRGHARRTFAVTAVQESRLAGLADRVIGLPMTYHPRQPGILSFSLSLLAVLKMAGMSEPCDFFGAFREAKGGKLGYSGRRGITYFLGNSLAHPAALYAAAKNYEILGAKAQAELLEQFSHLELFALGRSDFVNAFAFSDPAGVARRLSKALSKQGYPSKVVRGWGRTPMERLFHAVFLVQLSVLDAAAERGLTAPWFLSLRRTLNVSDQMIY